MAEQANTAAAPAVDIAALLKQLQQAGAASAPNPIGWQPQVTPIQQPTGISIPISHETQFGRIRIYMHFGPEAGSDPNTLNNLLQALHSAGFPLDFWQSQSSGWNGGRNGYNNRNRFRGGRY